MQEGGASRLRTASSDASVRLSAAPRFAVSSTTGNGRVRNGPPLSPLSPWLSWPSAFGSGGGGESGAARLRIWDRCGGVAEPCGGRGSVPLLGSSSAGGGGLSGSVSAARWMSGRTGLPGCLLVCLRSSSRL